MPDIGRFGQVDPVIENQEQYSLYQYGWGNPVLRSDPNGEFPGEGYWNDFKNWLNTPVTNKNAVAAAGGLQTAAMGFKSEKQTIGTILSSAVIQIGKGYELRNNLYSRAGAFPGAKSSYTAKSNIKPLSTNVQSPKATQPYIRPNNATTPAQRASVQNKPCVDCGKTEKKMVADHKTPLVKEHYETGTIDKKNMKSNDAVQPQCTNCSNKQGVEMRKYGQEKRKEL
jgi:hypothetical protein